MHAVKRQSAAPRFTDPPIAFFWPVGIVVAAAVFALSYPGRLNPDSLYAVITMSAREQLGNWHSPTLSWLWSIPGPLLGQPAGALLIQSILFGLYASFLPRVPATTRGGLTLAGEMLFRISLIGAFGYIGKDVVLLGAMLLWVQLLRYWLQTELRPGHCIVLASLAVIALLIKAPNFLTFVIAAGLVLAFFTSRPRMYLGMMTLGLILGALAIPLDRTVDRYAFAAKDLHPDKQLVIFDIAAISTRTGSNLFADVASWPTAKLPPVDRCFLPYMWDSFAPWGPCSAYSAAYDRLEAQVKRRWLRAILEHPLAYAQHRLTYSRYLLLSTDHRSWGIGGEAVNAAGSVAALNETAEMMSRLKADRPVQRWRPNPAVREFAWLEAHLFRFPKAQSVAVIGSLAILLLCWLQRRDGIRLWALVPVSLGLGNFLMLVVFGVADPARYLLPTMGMFYMAALALVAPGGGPGQRHPPPSSTLE